MAPNANRPTNAQPRMGATRSLRDDRHKDKNDSGDLLSSNDQWRAKAQRAFTAAQQQQTSLKGQLHDTVAQYAIRPMVRVFEVDADHQPQSADIADPAMALFQRRELVLEYWADLGGVRNQAFFQ